MTILLKKELVKQQAPFQLYGQYTDPYILGLE